MSKKSRLAAVIAGAALAIGGAATQVFASTCGDINNSGGAPCLAIPDACDSIDSIGVAQVVVGGGVPVASHCGGLGTLQCGDIVDDNAINIQDLVASLQLAADIEPLLKPCTNFGATLSCGSTVSGTLTSNQTWPGGCDTFVDGTTFVDNGAVITVQPGATVKGLKTSTDGSESVLIFLRGTKINAGGTETSPIVFTSDQAPGTRAKADWAGLILNGSAPVNFPGGEGACEGLPPGSCVFGGNEPNDSSGQLRYARVEFSGAQFGVDNELNTLTMNGVGRGTTIEFVQTNVGEDDNFEWFGGNVDTNHLVSTSPWDDSFDYQIGFQGSLQFGLTQQNVAFQIPTGGHNGIEGDNNEFGFDNPEISNPDFCNVTMVGSTRQGVTVSGSGANIRRGSAGKVGNTIFMDFQSAGLDIDDDDTIDHACNSATDLNFAEPVLRVQETILHNNGGAPDQTIGTTTAPDCTADQLAVMWRPGTCSCNTPACGGTCTNSQDPGSPFGSPDTCDADADCIGTELNVTATNPLPGVTNTFPISSTDNRYFPVGGGIADSATDCSTLRPDVFESTDYIGAFEPGGSTGTGENWMDTDGTDTAGDWISFATS